MTARSMPASTGVEEAPPPTKRARKVVDSQETITWRNIRRSWRAYALLAPIFVLLALFNYYPPLLGLSRAFYDWSPTKEPVFIGIENFRNYLFYYPESWREISNVFKFLVYAMFAHVAVPFLMAEAIFAVRSQTAKEMYRFGLVLPILVPFVVSMLLWRHIYDPAFGPINSFLDAVGLSALSRNWLGDPNTALYAIMAVNFPWVATIGTLIVLSGLGQISESIFDSCLLDGCRGLRRIVSIDVPLVMGQVRLLVILAVLGATQTFQNILILTRGGPGYITSVPGLTMYTRAFNTGQFGYASAIGVMLFVLGLLLMFVINRTLRSPADE